MKSFLVIIAILILLAIMAILIRADVRAYHQPTVKQSLTSIKKGELNTTKNIDSQND